MSRYLFFGLTGLAALMAALDQTMIVVAVPQLTGALNAPLGWVGWLMTAYQLCQVIVVPVAGKLSDDLGRKRVFMFCIAIFTVGSLLSAIAPNIGFLILFRAIQAIGAGGILPSAIGIISDEFADRRSQMIGLWTSIWPIGSIIGPNLGAWILENWSWRELFLANVPIGVVVLIGSQFLLPSRHGLRESTKVDLRGLALFAGGMVGLMYALTSGSNDPTAWRTAAVWLVLAGAGGLFVLFWRHEKRTEQPALEIDIATRQPFLAANLYNFVFGSCVYGLSSFIPYYAVVQYRMSTMESGAVLTPRAITMAVTMALTSVILLRYSYRRPMIVGALIMAGAFGLLSLDLRQFAVGPLALDDFWLMALVIGLTGVGMGLSSPSSSNAVIDLLPARAAAITGMRSMFRMTGGIMGISFVVLVLSFFDDKALGIRVAFFILSLVVLGSIPFAMMIPDTARERWLRLAGAKEGQPSVPAVDQSEESSPGEAGVGASSGSTSSDR